MNRGATSSSTWSHKLVAADEVRCLTKTGVMHTTAVNIAQGNHLTNFPACHSSPLKGSQHETTAPDKFPNQKLDNAKHFTRSNLMTLWNKRSPAQTKIQVQKTDKRLTLHEPTFVGMNTESSVSQAESIHTKSWVMEVKQERRLYARSFSWQPSISTLGLMSPLISWFGLFQ